MFSLETDLQTHEARRAKTLMPIFDQADILLDLHQNHLKDPDSPFYIFPDQMNHCFGHRPCVSHGHSLTQRLQHTAPPAAQMSISASEAKPAITVELSQKGLNPHAEDLSLMAIRRALGVIERSGDNRQ